MKCSDSLGTFGTISFINKKIILIYHIDKELDKPILIAKEEKNKLNKKFKKAKRFNKDILGIRRFKLWKLKKENI